jgi:hypothetical protein
MILINKFPEHREKINNFFDNLQIGGQTQTMNQTEHQNHSAYGHT